MVCRELSWLSRWWMCEWQWRHVRQRGSSNGFHVALQSAKNTVSWTLEGRNTNLVGFFIYVVKKYDGNIMFYASFHSWFPKSLVRKRTFVNKQGEEHVERQIMSKRIGKETKGKARQCERGVKRGLVRQQTFGTGCRRRWVGRKAFHWCDICSKSKTDLVIC